MAPQPRNNPAIVARRPSPTIGPVENALRRHTNGHRAIASGSIIGAWIGRSKNRQPTAMHKPMTTAKKTQP
jgi:hypothetical protein